MPHYALLDKLKLKLRLTDADQTLSEELEEYLTDVDSYINRKLRNWLGFIDIHGNPIIIPLTETTNIPVDNDLMQNATDLAYGKFRKEQNNEELNWENAKENFQTYLEDRFGWPEDEGHRVSNPTTIEYKPVDILLIGETITVAGTNYHQFQTITIDFNGQAVETTPETVFADFQGAFKNVKIIIPNNLTESKAFSLKARDGDQNQDNRAETFVSVNVDAGTNFQYVVDGIMLGTLVHNPKVDGILIGSIEHDFFCDGVLV